MIFLLSTLLVLLNLYGLTQSLRLKSFHFESDDMFRFTRKPPLSYKLSLNYIKKLQKLHSDQEFAIEATTLVNQSLAHLEWNALDPITSYQTIPIWENPLIWALGRFSKLPHYERYNFTHYKRTLERGFGICGDASMVLSQLLEKRGIDHNIVAFAGHVLIEATIDGQQYMLDPDYGIAIYHGIELLAKDKFLLISKFKKAGYKQKDALQMHRIINTPAYRYKNTFQFVPKRYLLERLSYWFFWFFPPLCLTISIFKL